MDQVGERLASKVWRAKITGCSLRGYRTHRTTFVWRRMREWRYSLCLWNCLTNIQVQPRPNHSQVEAGLTRTDHCRESFGQCHNALDGLPISSTHCWLDSSVALYWIRRQGEYKQFVANCVEKIYSHEGVTWHYVPTEDNPANLGSRM